MVQTGEWNISPRYLVLCSGLRDGWLWGPQTVGKLRRHKPGDRRYKYPGAPREPPPPPHIQLPDSLAPCYRADARALPDSHGLGGQAHLLKTTKYLDLFQNTWAFIDQHITAPLVSSASQHRSLFLTSPSFPSVPPVPSPSHSPSGLPSGITSAGFTAPSKMLAITIRTAARRAAFRNVAALRTASTWANVPQGPPVSPQDSSGYYLYFAQADSAPGCKSLSCPWEVK